MRYLVVNLGCKVNRVESDAFAARFLEKAWLPAAGQEADLVLINTCMVTGEAEKKTRKAIRKALREHSGALIVVTGCAAALNAQELNTIDERVYIEADKTKVNRAITSTGIEFDEINEGVSHEETPSHPQGQFYAYESSSLLRKGNGFVSRVGVKIQDGCNNACTFCIVHHARGKAWSRDKTSILEEVCAYEHAGVHEIVLTGINIGSYQNDNKGLSDLLVSLIQKTSKLRFRISSIEPRDVTDDLIELIAASQGRICRHIHLPLQSGSDKILREMARPYHADDYRALVDRIYYHIPNMSLSTDLIVGFPGETAEDFEKSIELAQYCRFSKIHVFPYSKREGTPAAMRNDQLDSQVKTQRVEHMTKVAETLRAQDYARRRNKVEYVLVENDGYATTESYHKIPVPTTFQPGDVIEIKLI